MTILNNTTDGDLSVLVAMARHLNAKGKVSKDELIEEFAYNNEPTSSRTVNRWTQIGLFVDADGFLNLPVELRGIDPLHFTSKLATSVRRLVFKKENNPEDNFFVNEKSLASDFTRSLAWSLYQEPIQFSGCLEKHEIFQGRINSQIEIADPLNDVKWRQFRRWAAFLGFIEGGLLDPTLALKGEIEEIFTNASSFIISDNKSTLLPIDKFLNQLSMSIPVLDGGEYQKRLQKVGTSLPRWSDENLSPALSLALFRLERNKVISLERRADASLTKILDMGHGHTVEVAYVGRVNNEGII